MKLKAQYMKSKLTFTYTDMAGKAMSLQSLDVESSHKVTVLARGIWQCGYGLDVLCVLTCPH